MRYALLSDIHGNLDALEAVLDCVQQEGVDHTICLGDVVGYGPQPAECLQLLQKNNSTVIAGNHDFAVAGKIDINNFNVLARESTLWTRECLDANDVEFLAGLPLVAEFDGFTIVHGNLHTPELFDYVQTCYDAHLSMQQMKKALCFIGHSHVPVAFVLEEIVGYDFGPRLEIDPEGKTILNVGSVGQPRDHDPRACFAVYDTDEQYVELKRVRYDIDSVVEKVQEAGLPRQLGERLRHGR